MQQAFEFYLPTRILFACGARRKLPEQLTRLGIRNLLLCTDKMLRSAGVVEKITSILDGCGRAVHDLRRGDGKSGQFGGR